MNKRNYHNALASLLMALLLTAAPVSAQQAGAPEEKRCTSCHNDAVNQGLHSIWQTAHGAAMGSGNDACVECHGDSREHRTQPTENPPLVSFGPSHPSHVDTRNGQCLGCHQGNERMMWQGSAHHDEDVACNDCHKAHTNRDKVLNDRDQVEVCVNCHTPLQAQLRMPSRHPIKEGKTSCSDCHNPHGSTTDASLVGTSLNATCIKCHTEKRGPFLFEHPPVAEDCSLCHKPHGAVNEDLLISRGPFLCQQCHSAAFHPSQLNDGSGLPSGSSNQNLLGKNCMNCHSQVHGSNHPSGGRLTR